jgi:hypothetical protein
MHGFRLLFHGLASRRSGSFDLRSGFHVELDEAKRALPRLKEENNAHLEQIEQMASSFQNA